MLKAAEKRLDRYGAPYQILVDDIESTKVKGHYDAVLLALVLLHVDWKKSLENMLRLNPYSFYIIEQKQDLRKLSVTKRRKLPPSIKKYAEVEGVQLIPSEELTDFMKKKGYKLLYRIEKPVPDNKKMVGFVYKK